MIKPYFKLASILLVLVLFSFPNDHLNGQTTWTEEAASYGLDLGGSKDGGFGWCDFDLDGDFDVLINRNTSPWAYFYRNDGGGVFTDITATHAPHIATVKRERCVVWGDLNNDGYPDFARNTSFGGIDVYLQDPATHVFGDGLGGTIPQNFSSSNVADGVNTEGVGFMDYDGDGDLDIIFDNHNFGIDLIENDGTGTFTHVTAKDVNYDINDPSTWPKGLAQDATDGDYGSTTDYNNDGWVDFVVRKRDQVDFFDNQGGAFGEAIDIDQANNGNKGAVNFSDFDNDGDFDLFWTENGTNQIHENVNGTWTPLGAITGIATFYPGDAIDGLACGDVDNDGDIDIFLAGDRRGHLYINQLNDPALGANVGTPMTFVKASYGFYGDGDDAGGLDDDDNSGGGGEDGEGCSFIDVDNDGDLDLYVNINNDSNRLYINQLSLPYRDNYIFVDIEEDRAIANMPAGVERDALGATLMLTDCDGNVISGIREINGGNGHGTQDVSRIHFGVPNGPDDYYILKAAFPNIVGYERLEINVEIVPSDYAYHLYTIEPATYTNSSPVAQDDDIKYCEGSAQIFDPLADNGNGADSDPDGDDIEILRIVTYPTNGIAVLNDDGTITYTPNYGYSGTDQLTYAITDNPECPASGAVDFATIYFSVAALEQSISCPADTSIEADPDQCSVSNPSIGIPVSTLSCGTSTVTNDAPNPLPVGTTTVTWTQNAEIIPTYFTDLAGCENAFPSSVNSTGGSISIGSGSDCDGSTCTGDNTASSINISVDLGSGSSGSYTVPATTNFDINSDRDLVNFSASNGVTLNFNQSLEFQCTGDFSIGNNVVINIEGDVVIQASAFDFGDNLVVNINAGSLTLISDSDIIMGIFTAINVSSGNAEDFIMLASNDIEMGDDFTGTGLFYCDNQLLVGNNFELNGSVTGGTIQVGDDAVFTYDSDAPSNFPCSLVTADLQIVNNGGAISYSLSYNENSIDPVINYDGSDPVFTEGSGLTWSLSGSDADDFTINTSSGLLNFINPPDFENPQDSDLNNIYSVVVSLTNGTSVVNQTLSVEVTDETNNIITCTQQVTVVDAENPVIICPGSQVVALNNNCEFELPDYSTLVTVTDNCTSIPAISQSLTPGSAITVSTPVIMIATDDSGNTHQCTVNVMPVDLSTPDLSCPSDQSVGLNN